MPHPNALVHEPCRIEPLVKRPTGHKYHHIYCENRQPSSPFGDIGLSPCLTPRKLNDYSIVMDWQHSDCKQERHAKSNYFRNSGGVGANTLNVKPSAEASPAKTL